MRRSQGWFVVRWKKVANELRASGRVREGRRCVFRMRSVARLRRGPEGRRKHASSLTATQA